ncbi:MAG: ornithine cyclodeaminase family protein [Betaproteobacteria bacterium]|nr:ornithine cyclodeaminase family protein [Betaproteobacteria bacterium]
MTLFITERDVEQMLSIRSAIPVMEEVFRMAGEGTAENPPRFRMPMKKGFMQFGPAALHARQVAGFKLWANFGSPLKQLWDFLYSMESGELLAVIQAHSIGTFRTAAATAVAVKHLSPADASVVGMYGSGRQAGAQLQAICAVRKIRTARVYSRTREKLEAFCLRMSAELKIEVVPAAEPAAVPRDADIVVTITKAETPVLLGDWLTRPCLVVGAGANHWYEREIDGKLIEQARLIVVDEKEHSKVESGDLLWAIAHGLLRWEQVWNLGDVVVGRAPGPDFRAGTILFESHGLAIEDVAIAAKAYELAKEQGRGTEISL